VTTTHPQEQSPYQVSKPAQPTPAAKKPTRAPTAPAPAAASSTPPPPPAPAAPAPKLGDILTPDEQKQYNAAIDQSLSRAQASLNSVGGRQLSKDQQAQLEQIRNFIQQAQAARGSDPAGGKSLSERAEVLARDLAASFH
jgi:ABC-type sugar transport system substrate-binding protein